MQLKKDTYLQGGKYRVISTLGQGGFGITYLAEQVMAKRMVCIKEFFPKEYYNRDADSLHISLGSEGNAKMMNAYKAKFIKEAQTIAKLKHPNIIPIFDVFEENNTAYYAMEYIEGESLNAKVKREGALAEDRAVKYIRDVASALRHIHKRNIMHLDVKPANIMLSKEDDSAILIDFGLSKQYDNAGKQTSATPVGISHGYAPMEQYQEGGVSTFSPVTDIYSLGATLYYLVTGRVPAEAATIGENGIGELPRLLSANVRNAITNAMSYWRKERPQSIDIFLAMFDETTTDNDVRDVKEADDTTKIGEAETVVTGEPVTPEPTPVTSKSDYDDIYIKPKGSGEKSEKTKKQKSRWWIWLLILVIAATVFFALRNRGNINPIPPVPTNEEIIIDTLSTGVQTTIDTEAIKIPTTPPNNEIWYTSSCGVIDPEHIDVFGASVISNTYKNGKGIITFDGPVTTIRGYSYNLGLKSVTIPDSVTTIGEYAFSNCHNLTSVNIGNSVTTIGYWAFYGCKSLTSVTIPNSVTTIGGGAFRNCSNLTSVTIGDSVTTIGDEAFLGCTSLTHITIPNSVTTIGGDTFQDCTGLTSITIPDNVTSIGEHAFFGCANLTSITIGDSVTTIGKQAFRNCTGLTSITIPDSVTTIGEKAFLGCNGLKIIYCKATTPPTPFSDFYNYRDLGDITIYVPHKSVGAYKDEWWWYDDDDIVGYDFEN